MSTRIMITALGAIAVLSPLSFGSEKKNAKVEAKAEAEAKQRAAEAEAEDALNPESALRTPILRGKFALVEPDDKTSKAIGTFTVGQREYRVELSREALRDEMEALNGKVVSLAGKIRDEGKTFIVVTIERGGPPPAAMSNPRGL